MSFDLPAGFLRAESEWLNPPEYRPSPDDIMEDADRVCKEANQILLTFAEEYCGGIEESYHIEETIKAVKILVTQLEPLLEELEEYEQIRVPDPDAAYDDFVAGVI